MPETPGGVRNWDYRYTWLRDSSLIIYALQLIGYYHEASAFLDWLNGLQIAKHKRVQIMYSVRGEVDLPEHHLQHLDGYHNSQPVRIGNAAYQQQQYDIYGEVLDATFLYQKKPLTTRLIARTKWSKAGYSPARRSSGIVRNSTSLAVVVSLVASVGVITYD